MKRWQKFGLLAAAVIVPVLSCGQRSLVLIDVKASNAFQDPNMLADVGISVTANRDVTTRFSHAHLLAGGTYQIGMYLPSDMTGTVTFVAEVDNGDCVFATGMATATGVQAGETTKAIDLLVMPTAECTPIHDGGAGTTGSGGTGGTMGAAGVDGMSGVAGVTGSAGTGTAGVGGTGGALSGTAGSSGAGGMTAGTAGRGGTTGTAGVGGMTTGTAGRGGTTGTAGIGGMQGTAGFGGAVGVGGAGGGAGRGGFGGGGLGGGSGAGGTFSTGVGGTGVGGTGAGGAAGGTGCGATTCVPPYICNGSGGCVCSETPAQACARAGVQCGYVVDNCGQQILCSCKIVGQVCDTANNVCMSGCVTGTGGIITADIICPV